MADVLADFEFFPQNIKRLSACKIRLIDLTVDEEPESLFPKEVGK